MYLHADSIIAIYISQQYKAGFKSKVDQTGDNCYVQVHVPSHHSFYLSVCLDNAFPRQLCRNLKKLTWLVRRRKDKLSSSTQNKKFPTVCKVWTRGVTCCFRGSSFFLSAICDVYGPAECCFVIKSYNSSRYFRVSRLTGFSPTWRRWPACPWSYRHFGRMGTTNGWVHEINESLFNVLPGYNYTVIGLWK